MEVVLDSDVKAVAEFMQNNIPAAKLIGVAEALPTLASILWSQYPQESVQAAIFDCPKTGLLSQSQPDAI
jgi:hypothetical protein